MKLLFYLGKSQGGEWRQLKSVRHGILCKKPSSGLVQADDYDYDDDDLNTCKNTSYSSDRHLKLIQQNFPSTKTNKCYK